MKLLHLHIENFGTLHDFELTPTDGLNVLYQKNGWGKSTLAVFIKAMLYGLPVTTKRSLDENERKKYTPWQGGAFGGSLEFESSKGRFRVERFFGAKEANDTFALFDLSTNKPSEAYSASLGEELFGIDADGFERSTYLSQRPMSGGRDGGSISAKLGSLLDDVGDIGDYETAMAVLDKRRSYYVKTGNRGAIAEAEQELFRLQNDLEHCLEKEKLAGARRTELESCNVSLHAQEQAIEQNRTDMQKAGLGREKAAHAERKNNMLDELRRLSAARDRINDFFRNAPPSAAELFEGRRLYEEIKEANARLDAIPNEIPEAQTLTELRRRYPKGAPSSNTLQRIESDSNELVSLHAQLQVLSEVQDDGILRKFPSGAPDRAEIEEAYQSIKEATRLRAAAVGEREKAERKQPSALPKTVGILLLVAGVGMSALSWLPSMKFLLIIGLALLFGGVTALILTACKQSAYCKMLAETERICNRQTEEARRLVQGVGEMLVANGIVPVAEQDIPRELDTLASLSDRYWGEIRKKKKREENIQTIRRHASEISARLHKCFSAIDPAVPYKEDYRRDLEQMRRDLTTLAYLESAERARLQEKRQAKQVLDEKREELIPFLRRFDPAGKMRAGACLNYVSEQSVEFRRLEQEIAERKSALSGFIVEKRLDVEEELPDSGAYERIAAAEKKLQEELTALHQKRSRLLSELEQLSHDTDRIPELLDAVEQQKQRLTEMKANSATVANTMRYLEQAKNALSTRYLGGMQESFGRYLSLLTDKTAPEAVMDSSFEVRLREGGQSRSMEQFSRGWRDAVEFCIRLSLSDALYSEGEKPFLLLDDPFVNLDDERLNAARSMLEELARECQILYFVCHRERI